MTITPQELKDYSTFKTVKNRPDDLLDYDIIEAETYVSDKLEKPLSDYEPLPTKLRLALLKVAQFFALVNSDESIAKGYKSEKIGDYSYTLQDGTSMRMPDISSLIADYLPESESKDGFFMRIRPL